MPTEFDVIFFDSYAPKKLPPSGNFVCINSVPEGLKIKPVIENGAPVIMDDATVLDWKRDHPMLQGGCRCESCIRSISSSSTCRRRMRCWSMECLGR